MASIITRRPSLRKGTPAIRRKKRLRKRLKTRETGRIPQKRI